MTKKLHELIELAKSGKKFSFKATSTISNVTIYNQNSFNGIAVWSENAITADWEYIVEKEPLVVELDVEWAKDMFGPTYPIAPLGDLSLLVGKSGTLTFVEKI